MKVFTYIAVDSGCYEQILRHQEKHAFVSQRAALRDMLGLLTGPDDHISEKKPMVRASKRKSWPFSRMQVGEETRFRFLDMLREDNTLPDRLHWALASVTFRLGYRFKSHTEHGELVVKRVS